MWESLTVSQLIDASEADLQTGPFGTQLKASDYVESGTPVINVRNIGMGGIRDAELEYLDEAMVEKLHAHQLCEGDIVFGRKGAVERHALIGDAQDGWVQGSDCLRLRISSDRVCNRFLSYYFRTNAHQHWMQAVCSFGATMSSLNQDIVSRISFPHPPFKVQRKIAAVLTSYDDLIANNKRRIELLQQTGIEAYKEWFVRLRFPGHEKSVIEKRCPAGWNQMQLSEISNEVREGVAKAELADDELYLGLEHLPRRSFALTDFTTADTVDSNKLRFQERDILFGKIRPYLHKVVLSHLAGACSTDTIVIRPTETKYEGFLLFTVFSDSFIELATIASKGTKMPRADWDFLKTLELVVPNDKVLTEFQSNFETTFAQISNLLEANVRLCQTRDLLLGRLISGRLPVAEIDLQFPDSMIENVEAESEEELVNA